jgi:hypothetical protein
MSPDVLISTVRELVEQLARKDYEGLIARCATSRLTSDDLRNVVQEYGRTPISPPPNAYQNLDAIEVDGTAVPTWSVRAPLWTKEEGRSDLELQMTIVLRDGSPSVELDDLLVP